MSFLITNLMSMTKQRNKVMGNTLQEIAKLECLLLEKGGAEKDGNLFEEIIGLQEDVLKMFGLPLNDYYFSVVSFDVIPDEIEVKKRIDQLHEEATEYLTSSVKSDIQVLRDAQDTEADPLLVLPELKFPTHVYTIFLIEKMLIEKKEKPEAILDALKIATTEYDILDVLGRYVSNETNDDEKWKLFAFAMDKDVRYLKDFVLQ